MEQNRINRPATGHFREEEQEHTGSNTMMPPPFQLLAEDPPEDTAGAGAPAARPSTSGEDEAPEDAPEVTTTGLDDAMEAPPANPGSGTPELQPVQMRRGARRSTRRQTRAYIHAEPSSEIIPLGTEVTFTLQGGDLPNLEFQAQPTIHWEASDGHHQRDLQSDIVRGRFRFRHTFRGYGERNIVVRIQPVRRAFQRGGAHGPPMPAGPERRYDYRLRVAPAVNERALAQTENIEADDEQRLGSRDASAGEVLQYFDRLVNRRALEVLRENEAQATQMAADYTGNDEASRGNIAQLETAISTFEAILEARAEAQDDWDEARVGHPGSAGIDPSVARPIRARIGRCDDAMAAMVQQLPEIAVLAQREGGSYRRGARETRSAQARMRDALQLVQRDIANTRTALQTGDLDVLDADLVVGEVRGEISEAHPRADAIVQQMMDQRATGNTLANVGLMGAQIGLLFVPGIGPYLAAGLGIAIAAHSWERADDLTTAAGAGVVSRSAAQMAQIAATLDTIFAGIDVGQAVRTGITALRTGRAIASVAEGATVTAREGAEAAVESGAREGSEAAVESGAREATEGAGRSAAPAVVEGAGTAASRVFRHNPHIESALRAAGLDQAAIEGLSESAQAALRRSEMAIRVGRYSEAIAALDEVGEGLTVGQRETTARALSNAHNVPDINAFRGSTVMDAARTAEVNGVLANLRQRFQILRQVPLDAGAIARVMRCNPNIDAMKGQLLEELIAVEVRRELGSTAGRSALGLADGERIFIDGHRITDMNGAQITDGIAVRSRGGRLEADLVVEAKAGQASSRGLATTSGSITAMSPENQRELLSVMLGGARQDVRRFATRRLRLSETAMENLTPGRVDHLPEQVINRITGNAQLRRAAGVRVTTDELALMSLADRVNLVEDMLGGARPEVMRAARTAFPGSPDVLRNLTPNGLANLTDEQVQTLVQNRDLRVAAGIESISERGGQMRRDIERLGVGDGGGPTRLMVDGQAAEIIFSPTRTRFLGAVPSDVAGEGMQASLREQGVSATVRNVDVTQAQLIEICQELLRDLI